MLIMYTHCMYFCCTIVYKCTCIRIIESNEHTQVNMYIIVYDYSDYNCFS